MVVTLTDACSSIEGKLLLLQGRKFNLKLPRRVDQNLQYPFKLGVGAKGHVETCLLHPAEPFFDTSITNAGAKLVGDSINGHATKPISSKVAHGSAKHKATFIQAKGHAYAHIEIPKRELLQKKRVSRKVTKKKGK